MDAIAKRTFVYQDAQQGTQELIVQVGKPYQDNEGVWCCDFSLGAPVGVKAHACGEDAMQALLLSLVGIRAHLESAKHAGKVTWLGSKELDLGLPRLEQRIILSHPRE